MKRFIDEFKKQLAALVKQHPDLYPSYVADPEGAVAACAGRLLTCLESGNRNYNNVGPAIRNTCKALGIKSSYTAIERYIANHV